MLRNLIGLTAVLCLAGSAVAAPPPSRTLENANEVLDELNAIPEKAIPSELLADAQAVAIIPRVVKAGFVFGGRLGHGVVLTRDKSGDWGDPVFIDLTGASVGFQAGVESTDVVLVFKSRKSVERLMEGRGKLTLGADAAIAAGPLGRQAAAATDARLDAEILSYSRSRGLFAGVSLDGAAVVSDRQANARFRRDLRLSTEDELRGLRTKLEKMSGDKPTRPAPEPAMPKQIPTRGPELPRQ